jgi:DNA invertase Pin-like site-specific DNA recombinase
VPTHDQQTLQMQLAAMRDYVRKREWHVAIDIRDIGSEASVRPQREELLQAARRREIDLVLVWAGPLAVKRDHEMNSKISSHVWCATRQV